MIFDMTQTVLGGVLGRNSRFETVFFGFFDSSAPPFRCNFGFGVRTWVAFGGPNASLERQGGEGVDRKNAN